VKTLRDEIGVAALEDTLQRYGHPDIFGTDQCQFFRKATTPVLKDAGFRISMEGKGRWMVNIIIERLRLSLKYECFY